MLVSAVTGEGVDTLLGRIEQHLAAGRPSYLVILEPADGSSMNWLYEQAEILERRTDQEGRTLASVRIAPEKEPRFLQRFPGARSRDCRRGLYRRSARLWRAFLRLHPELFHVVEGGVRGRSAAGREGLLDRRRSGARTWRWRRASADFGIDAGMAGEIGGREQEIADLVLDLAARAGLERLADLAHFLLDLADDLGGVGPVEADGRGLAGELFGAGEGGQAGRNPARRPAAAGSSASPRSRRRSAFSACLDLAPERLDACRREVARVAEHVRMAADQLGRDALDDVAEIERAGLLGHPGVEHDLEQQVAELVLEVEKIAARDRVGDLIGFLDRVGRDGREILLEVPRAARCPACAAPP